MAFYKYLKKEHLQQFQKQGTVALGNIELYRDIENRGIRDPFEGRTVYSIAAEKDPIDLSVEQVNAITNDYHITAPLRIAPGSFFRDSLKVPNAFAFSVSCKLDNHLMRTLGYDTCYTITDIDRFMTAVYAELNRQHQLLFSVAEKVRYVQTKTITITNANKNTVIRTTPYNKSKSDRIKTIYIEDYFTKPDSYVYEEEFRLVFIPASSISKDIVLLQCKELLNYCDFQMSLQEHLTTR